MAVPRRSLHRRRRARPCTGRRVGARTGPRRVPRGAPCSSDRRGTTRRSEQAHGHGATSRDGPGPPRSTQSGWSLGPSRFRRSDLRGGRGARAAGTPGHRPRRPPLSARARERAQRARRRHRLGRRVRGGSRHRPPALLERTSAPSGAKAPSSMPTDRSPRTISPAHACSRSASTRSSLSTATARRTRRCETKRSEPRENDRRLKRALQTPSPANPRAHRT